MRKLPVVLPIPISKCWFQAARTHETIKSPWVIKGILHCQFAILCTFNEALVWGILELEFWTHQQIVANIWCTRKNGKQEPQNRIELLENTGAMHGHMFVKSALQVVLTLPPSPTTATDQYPMDRVRGLTPQSLILNLQWLFWIYLFFFASIQFWWFSLSSISCHHRLQWYIWHIWAPILHCVAFRHFPDLTFKQLCLDPSSWHHLHQTPSLGPFISDVVAEQPQMSETGVLLQGLGQSLSGDTSHDLRSTMKHTAHT